MAALELAPIVAAYLRKNGFLKTLAAFSRENGETLEEEDVVDLETLLKLYTSTQLNGNRETKKSKKAKFKDTLDMANGNENTRDNAEEKVNGGAAPKSKKKKKGEKENLVDSLMVPKTETKNILKEEGLKKKKEENSKVNENTEGLKLKGKNCLTVAGTLKPSVEEALSSGHAGHDSASNKIVVGTHIENGGGLTIEQEVAHPHPPESLNSRSKKTKKEQGGEQLAGSKAPTRLPDSTQVSSQENGLSKKKRKKSKDAGEEETTKAAIAAESACETPMNDQSKKLNVTKRPVELLGEPGGCGFSSKKKKQRKEFSLEGVGDINGNIQEPSGVKLEASKNEEDPFDSKKQSGMKRKHREDTSLVNGISNHDHNNSMASPENTKGGGSNVIHQWNVEKHESDSTKENKHKETPNNKQTPTGALAFKRVEVEKVSFSDPRLRDNSYWAKDGAEQGYGAKAQEVLGLVRGRDFRHEKTKKKRGSYRGGLIGFQSHSIKFQNSDED